MRGGDNNSWGFILKEGYERLPHKAKVRERCWVTTNTTQIVKGQHKQRSFQHKFGMAGIGGLGGKGWKSNVFQVLQREERASEKISNGGKNKCNLVETEIKTMDYSQRRANQLKTKNAGIGGTMRGAKKIGTLKTDKPKGLNIS